MLFCDNKKMLSMIDIVETCIFSPGKDLLCKYSIALKMNVWSSVAKAVFLYIPNK